ncbi:hypothetical protein HNR42_001634 [Deinobacterium chartae]|uniref:GNAT family N-acetyltransferase n=1 Tax=Deinobacterium chartae TaxID=521158 RepID=A0A841I1D2_9DEIO|nr:DUF2992 family protein [Deinobacterium chartae]MBB6098209.1 hypothetical protein [Deinobacterium chartae]
MLVQRTVDFEDPCWVGVFERLAGRRREAARAVFGAEPNPAELYA